MAETTGIAWCDATWNPVTGCSKVSPGCAHCYAEAMSLRLQKMGQSHYKDGFTVRTHMDALDLPTRWRRPRRIFVNSMSDLFHNEVPEEFVDYIFAIMASASQHTYLILTKRPQHMRAYLGDRQRLEKIYSHWYGALDSPAEVESWPLTNVWLGVTAENQETADRRIPLLLEIPAAVRFVSCEPLLRDVDLARYLPHVPTVCGCESDAAWCPYSDHVGLDWVIVGGESGPQARPMHPDWVRSLRDQCQAAGVPFFFKQWGEFIHHSQRDAAGVPMAKAWPWDSDYVRVGKKAAGDLLDGRQWHEFPELGGRLTR